MNVMHFLQRSIPKTDGHKDGWFWVSDQFPLEDEEIAETAINAMLLVMNNKPRVVGEHHTENVIDDYAPLVLCGVAFPWKDRIALPSEVDLLNDSLPDMAVVGLAQPEGDYFAQAVYVVTPTTNDWKRFSALNGAKKVYRLGMLRGRIGLPKSVYRTTDRRDEKDIETLVSYYYAAVMPDGVCVGCDRYGKANFRAGNMAAYVIGMHNDRKYFWDVCAIEEYWDGYPAKAHFSIDEEYVKSLFYARSIPITATGRLKPILHWVQAHKRRLKAGVDIDVRKHLRGIHEFAMHGVNFKIDQPKRIDRNRKAA